MDEFDELESNVRYYCRRWPVVFADALGSILTDEQGHEYVDFFSGAGALSYGHNDPVLVDIAVEHLRSNRLAHSLDMYTPEKRDFLRVLNDLILGPRDMDYLSQFVGPTGATAVEAALHLAYRATKHCAVIAYEGGYHGMTARAATVSETLADSSPLFRDTGPCTLLPYVKEMGSEDVDRLEDALCDNTSGETPGALIIEPVQGEGGVRPFPADYLGEVRRLCSRYGVVLIADDIQAGVGRTGPFFSFEGTGLDPDIICISKSISGLGLPLSLNLIARDLDLWNPGEFTGTFRGPNLAFASAAGMIRTYWSSSRLEADTGTKSAQVSDVLHDIAIRRPESVLSVRAKGLIHGIEFIDGAKARLVADEAFRGGLLVETCGADSATVKLLPSLTIDANSLARGLAALRLAVDKACL